MEKLRDTNPEQNKTNPKPETIAFKKKEQANGTRGQTGTITFLPIFPQTKNEY